MRRFKKSAPSKKEYSRQRRPQSSISTFRASSVRSCRERPMYLGNLVIVYRNFARRLLIEFAV